MYRSKDLKDKTFAANKSTKILFHLMAIFSCTKVQKKKEIIIMLCLHADGIIDFSRVYNQC